MAQPLDRIECVLGDLTTQTTDAIVNAANAALRGGGGVDGAIHRAAGPGLLAECIERHPDGCPTGQARLTGGHDLPARHVVHVVGPVWQGGAAGEPKLLASCHHAAVELAAAHGIGSLAFPAISCGVFGYPPRAAAEVAVQAVAAALAAHPTVTLARFVLFSPELLEVFAGELARQRGAD